MAYGFVEPSRRLRQFRDELLAALASVILPYIALRLYAPDGDLDVLWLSFVGCLAAALMGAWALRSLSRYPGVEASASVLTAFCATFAMLLIFFILGRLEYSRIMLVASFVLILILFYAMSTRTARRTRMRIGVIGGHDSPLPEPLWQVDWIPLRDPDISTLRLDAVAVNLRIDLPDIWDRTLADYALMGLPVFHTKHLVEALTGRVELEHLSENSFGTLSPLSVYMAVKHVADWLLALAVGLLTLPVLLGVAVAVRLGSPGPALFSQQRMGYRGCPFRVFKFRTMTDVVPGTDERFAAMTAQNDKRVTPIGAFLRRTRIDELPQLVNVLRGEMSWIGPRPEAVVLSRWYEQEIPFYRYRHIVRPGITGWAQVNQGHVVEITDVTSKLHYDFYYIKNYGPWIDILIIARTIKTMLTGDGAK